MVVLYVAWLLGMQASTGMWTMGACIGAVATLLLVIHLGTRQGWPDPLSTILAGVIVATMASGAMVLLQSMVPEGLRGRFLAWAMGTVPELPSHGLLVALWCLLGVSAIGAVGWARRLDALLLGDDTASSLGAQPGLVRLVALLVAGLLTALCVALAGPLAFVGLVAPHGARRLLGPDHRWLVPGAMLFGAALVTGADALRQAIDVGTGRLPVGILTTLLGGPAFLFLLRREMGGRRAGM
jgi:iron complex transport system permease protein